jgi:hypothetical protein
VNSAWRSFLGKIGTGLLLAGPSLVAIAATVLSGEKSRHIITNPFVVVGVGSFATGLIIVFASAVVELRADQRAELAHRAAMAAQESQRTAEAQREEERRAEFANMSPLPPDLLLQCGQIVSENGARFES